MDKKTLDKSKIMKNALKKMRKKDIPKPESKNNRTRSTPPHTKSTPFNPSAPKISLVIHPCCLPFSSLDVSLENLVLDQLIIP